MEEGTRSEANRMHESADSSLPATNVETNP